MAVGALLSLEEYLNTPYSPDKEYRDGVLVERNGGSKRHARLQTRLAKYIGNRQKQWAVEPFTELRVKVRENWYPIPDVCVYELPDLDERYPTHPPLLWIQILSPDDRMTDVWNKAKELVENSVPYVWIIDPETLESELWTAAGVERVTDKTLRLPNSTIVIPLADVMAE